MFETEAPEQQARLTGTTRGRVPTPTNMHGLCIMSAPDEENAVLDAVKLDPMLLSVLYVEPVIVNGGSFAQRR